MGAVKAGFPQNMLDQQGIIGSKEITGTDSLQQTFLKGDKTLQELESIPVQLLNLTCKHRRRRPVGSTIPAL